MKQIVWFLAVLISPGILIAQIDYNESFFSQTFSMQNMQSEAFIEIIDGVATMRYSQHEHLVRGSPYLYDEFLFGVMTTVEAVRIEGLKYRYDIYSDEMQFILKNDTASVTRPLTLRSIQIGQQKFVYDIFQTGENTASAGYFEVIEEGKRTALKHSRILIHQPMGGAQGQASDIEITAREIQKLKKELYEIIAMHSGQTHKKIWKDADRDYWMTSEEAKDYGMIDEVLLKTKKEKI